MEANEVDSESVSEEYTVADFSADHENGGFLVQKWENEYLREIWMSCYARHHRRLMHGAGGIEEKNLVKLTWNQFQEWQRWDEFPEMSDNLPMTVDVTFIFRDRVYYLDMINYMFAILTEEWQPIETDANFLNLVTKPIEKWDGRSFCELIEEIRFVD